MREERHAMRAICCYRTLMLISTPAYDATPFRCCHAATPLYAAAPCRRFFDAGFSFSLHADAALLLSSAMMPFSITLMFAMRRRFSICRYCQRAPHERAFRFDAATAARCRFCCYTSCFSPSFRHYAFSRVAAAIAVLSR